MLAAEHLAAGAIDAATFAADVDAEILSYIVDDATKIDRLTVRWPSGKQQEFKNLAAGTRVTITEGESEMDVAALIPAKGDAAPPAQPPAAPTAVDAGP